MGDATAFIVGVAVLVVIGVLTLEGADTVKLLNDCEAQLTLRSAHCELVAVPINDAPAASGEE